MDIKTFKETFKFICERCGEFSQTSRGYCKKCGAHALRMATKEDYTEFELMGKQGKERILIKEKKVGEPKVKVEEEDIMINKILEILPKITKNDEEYHELLKEKRMGISVEDLIMQNRSRGEKLSKEKEQIIEEAIKLGINEKSIKTIDKKGIFNTKTAIRLCESMIDIETELKDKKLKKKKKKDLTIRFSSLLNQVVIEFSKLAYPFPLEESLFFQEPYISLLKQVNALISPKFSNKGIEIASQESIIRLEVRLNDPSLIQKERERLKQKYISLLIKTKREFAKPMRPLFFLSMSGEVKYYKEPYKSYFESLISELSLMNNRNPEVIIEVKKEVDCMFQYITQHRDELFAVYSKYLDQKENVDKIIDRKEVIEIKSRGALEFLLGFSFARKQTIENKIEKASRDKNVKIKLQEDLSEKQELIENVKQKMIFLDKIIEHTEILKDDNLNEEEKKYYFQEREKFRTEYKDKLGEKEIGFKIQKEMGRYIRVNETLKLMLDQSLKELLGKKPIRIRFCLECGAIVHGNISLCVYCGTKME